MKRLQTTYANNDTVRIFGINAWDERPKALAMIKKMGLNYPQLMDGDAVAKAYGVRGIPSLFVIGKDGKVLVSDGSAHDAEAAIAAALKPK